MTAAEAADPRQVPQGPKEGGASLSDSTLEKRTSCSIWTRMRSLGVVTALAEVAARVSTLCSRLDFLTSPLLPLSQGQTLSLDEAAAAAFVQRRS